MGLPGKKLLLLFVLSAFACTACATGGGRGPSIRKDPSGQVDTAGQADVDAMLERMESSGGTVRVEVAARDRDDVDGILGELVGEKLIDQNTVFRSDGSRFFSLEIGNAVLDKLIADPLVLEINYLKPPRVKPRQRRTY